MYTKEENKTLLAGIKALRREANNTGLHKELGEKIVKVIKEIKKPKKVEPLEVKSKELEVKKEVKKPKTTK